MKIKNIAIIAHVDHGKTTLVDKMLLLGELFRKNEQAGELILDNNDLERERGITILAKNVSIRYKDFKINIIDTPGHADFGGEVERVLNMADGALLLVDAFEGPMPQTRFVLQKALNLGLKPILVINKVDKPNCRPEEVHEQVFDLMFNLDATEDQLNFPTVYGSAKESWMSTDWKQRTTDIAPLMECIIENVPDPKAYKGTPQMLITSLDYSAYVGRIAIGRIHRGELKEGMNISIAKRDGSIMRSKIKELMVFEGLAKVKCSVVNAGEICAIVGLESFDIGDTICDYTNPEPLPAISIDEPTMSMMFTINNSPFFGKEGKFVTSRHLKDRLLKELEKNLAMRMLDTDSADSFIVFGRGVLHLSILLETMRREGYEVQVGQPRVIIKEVAGERCEPIEIMAVDVPTEFSGAVIEHASKRKGELKSMEHKGDRVHMEFDIPSRGIIGLRHKLLTSSNGEVIMTHRFKAFEPLRGEIEKRINGSLIAGETGHAIAYSLDKFQERGFFFVDPGDEIYEGQVVGENCKTGDITLNLTMTKKLTNMRASGTDEKMRITPARKFSLEEALEYIQEDEYVEVTPKSIRLRKIILKENERDVARKRKQL